MDDEHFLSIHMLLGVEHTEYIPGEVNMPWGGGRYDSPYICGQIMNLFES